MKSSSLILKTPSLAVAAAIGLLAAWTSEGVCDAPARQYRKVLVPAEHPESWPREGKSLLPIEAREFNQWVEAANEPPSTATIVVAEYHARLEGNRLVETNGWWKVERQGARTARLPLDSAALAISDPRWRGPDAPEARLGWSSVDDGKMVRRLDVPAAGILDFEWRVVGRSSTDEDPVFRLEFPPATQTRLVLDLPAFNRPDLDGIAIVQAPDSSEQGGRWVLALPSRREHLLRIADANRPGRSTSDVSYRQTCRYAVHRTGIDLEATLELSSSEVLPKSIAVRMPRGMKVVAAESDGAPLEWHLLAQPEGRMNVVSIELPAGTIAGSLPISVLAWGPFAADAPQQLQLLAIDKSFWSSGALQLEIDESLRLSQLAPRACLQTAAAKRDSAERRDRTLSFAAYSPDAAVDVTIGHRSFGGEVHSGVSLELGGAEIAGRVVAHVDIERGQVHQLTAELGSAWIIDAVESLPADVLGEWYVDKSVSPHVLRLQLQRAISAGEAVEFVSTVRSPVAATESISLSALSPLRWQSLQSAERLLQLRPAELYDLEIDGQWNELSVNQFPAGRRTLLAPADNARAAIVGDDDEATIRLLPKKVAYDATVQVDATLMGKRCDLSYRLVCNPRGGGIDHVLVYFAQPPGERLQWIDADSSRPLNAEKMPASDPRFGGLPTGGELWRLEFGRLYARPITIEVTRSVVGDEHRKIPLISLPDAASQQGRVTVANRGQATPSLVARNMTPAPLPLQTEAIADVCAIYRFQPTRFYDSAAVPELSIDPFAAADSIRPIATRIDIDSRYGMDGTSVHRARYQLSTGGAGELALRLPDGFAVTGALADDRPVPVARSNQIAIPLPTDTPQSVVEVEYVSRGRPLANGSRLVSPVPLGEYSMLAGEWKLSLPAGFTAVDVASELNPNWRERLFGILARRAARPFNPVDAGDWNAWWAQISGMVSSSAQAAVSDATASADNSPPTGMETYHFAFGVAPPPDVKVAHRRATAAVALAAFMFSAVGAQIFHCRMRTKIWLAITTAAASLVLPAAWAPLATAATLGLIAALIWSWTEPLIERRYVAAAMALLATGCSAASQAAPEPPAIERVLVPVDKDGQPVGTKYFVSTDFLRHLLAQADAAAPGGDTLVIGMRCDGQLVQESGSEVVTTGDWRLNLDIAASARDSIVTLPIVESEAEWPATASLDGIPVPIRWRDDGRGCMIHVAEPGRGRISIEFVPHVNQTGEQRRVTLTVPPIVGAEVHIVGPRGLSSLRDNRIVFDENTTADETVWRGELDSSGQLTCTWPAGIGPQASVTNRQVSQLQWLHVAQAGVDLNLKLVRRGEAEWPETVTFAVDTAWRWRDGQPFESQTNSEQMADGRQRIVVHVPPEARREPQLEFGFVNLKASTCGRMRPPAIDVTSVPLADRWLAVACDSTLECQPSGSVGSTNNLPAKFAADLNLAGADAPQTVVDLERIDQDWYLDMRPAPLKSSSRDRLSIAAGQDRFRINYQVDVVPQGAERFGWSLHVPADLSIESASLAVGDQQHAIDWVRAGAERVNLFFEQPVERAYQIELRGRLPMPDDGVLPLPKFGPADGSNASQTVALYRDDDVLAEWQFADEPPWVESGASLAPPFDETAKFVRAFAVDTATGQSTRVFVDRSRPRLSGSTCTQVVHSKNRWEAVWKCDLQVEQGAVDTLRIEAPPEWAGPFEVSPAASVQSSGPSTTRRNAAFTIRLPRPAKTGDRVRLAVRSPLSLAESQLLSAPRIQLLVEGRRSEFLSLPKSLDGEPISWTRSGIEPDELPSGLTTEPATSENVATYRILNDTVNVALRPRPARADLASIRLAETTTLLDAGDNTLEVTRFLISPAGLDRCNLEIPEGRRLVRANLNGRPALVRFLDSNRVEVQFCHPNLPQTLDVVTQAVAGETKFTDRIELIRPVLTESGRVISIDLSIWTLRGNLGERLLRAQNCARLSPAELAKLRLEWTTSISQRASGAVLEVPAVDGYSWFVRWAAQLTAAARLAEQAGRSSTVAVPAIRVTRPEGNSSEDPTAQSLLWIEQMSEFFNVTPASLADEQGTNPETIEPGQLALSGAGDVACFVSDGGRGPLVVELRAATWTAAQTRCALLATLGAMALVTIWLTRTPGRLERVENWPEAWGLLLGLAAWIWLRPSLVGLGVAIVSATLLVRHVQRETKSPRHDSSKLPNSIPEELA